VPQRMKFQLKFKNHPGAPSRRTARHPGAASRRESEPERYGNGTFGFIAHVLHCSPSPPYNKSCSNKQQLGDLNHIKIQRDYERYATLEDNARHAVTVTGNNFLKTPREKRGLRIFEDSIVRA